MSQAKKLYVLYEVRLHPENTIYERGMLSLDTDKSLAQVQNSVVEQVRRWMSQEINENRKILIDLWEITQEQYDKFMKTGATGKTREAHMPIPTTPQVAKQERPSYIG